MVVTCNERKEYLKNTFKVIYINLISEKNETLLFETLWKENQLSFSHS